MRRGFDERVQGSLNIGKLCMHRVLLWRDRNCESCLIYQLLLGLVYVTCLYHDFDPDYMFCQESRDCYSPSVCCSVSLVAEVACSPTASSGLISKRIGVRP